MDLEDVLTDSNIENAGDFRSRRIIQLVKKEWMISAIVISFLFCVLRIVEAVSK
jgi:hypothetical protein